MDLQSTHLDNIILISNSMSFLLLAPAANSSRKKKKSIIRPHTIGLPGSQLQQKEGSDTDVVETKQYSWMQENQFDKMARPEKLFEPEFEK